MKRKTMKRKTMKRKTMKRKTLTKKNINRKNNYKHYGGAETGQPWWQPKHMGEEPEDMVFVPDHDVVSIDYPDPPRYIDNNCSSLTHNKKYCVPYSRFGHTANYCRNRDNTDGIRGYIDGAGPDECETPAEVNKIPQIETIIKLLLEVGRNYNIYMDLAVINSNFTVEKQALEKQIHIIENKWDKFLSIKLIPNCESWGRKHTRGYLDAVKDKSDYEHVTGPTFITDRDEIKAVNDVITAAITRLTVAKELEQPSAKTDAHALAVAETDALFEKTIDEVRQLNLKR
jgi:hypothetical protein